VAGAVVRVLRAAFGYFERRLQRKQMDGALLPQLDEAQKAMMVALEEACTADLSRLDTPGLLKIEEKLDEASKAAKEAVSVRLRLESQSAGAKPESSASQLATDPSGSILHREFDDERGKRWHAFAVQSSSAMGGRAALPDAFRNGWLVFDSADEVRRVAPIPAGWVDFPIDKLRALCESTEGSAKRVSALERDQGTGSRVTP
jgi:hypothetical protein